ncbi:hypothetical protein DFR86_04720 [Acidianus sulfidivorans JP7]|uniref:Uncharacterized protein n=1 Tax=Acidianus sulfidivorans JP7 TaxID=619593 RepID=A0A2U9ILJ7_9CREN|nr:hypothetical protein [Acidianus sulfidivorans]AWR96929.1 hypothetical protein DFR86_04720 [Acidianus sulfidivorans JP7]
MEIADIIKYKPYKYIFLSVFFLYFLFFQYSDRLLIFEKIIMPPNIAIVLSTSPPVNPAQMPFPLWGPFFSITTSFFTWALTPISLSISIILSLLVSTNITLYIIYYKLLKIGAKKSLVSSLGIIATSLSCSCELFTALIGSATSSLPFLFSLSFMDRLSESLVILAFSLLSFSTYVLYNEINNKKPLTINITIFKKYILLLIFILIAVLIPYSVAFSFMKIVSAMLAGGIFGSIIKFRSKYLFYVGVLGVIAIFAFYPQLYLSPLIIFSSFVTGLFGSMGFLSMKKWVRLGIIHVIAWTMIMPGPISLLIGAPIPFFNFSTSELLELWIYTWIAGTPIAWFAGIYYLQYLRDSMSQINLENISFPKLGLKDSPDIKWILIGAFAILSQVIFYITHVADFVDYNGFDYTFLVTMTVASTLIITAGAISIGYGIYKILKSKYNLIPVNRKNMITFSAIYGLVVATLGGIIHFNVSGFTYPHVYLFTFGIPMMNPAILLYYPPYIGIYANPLEILQLILVSIIGGYLISILKIYSGFKKNAYALSLGGLGICPACFLSTYVLAAVSASLSASALFSLSSELIISFTADIILFLSLYLVLKRNKGYCELNIKTRSSSN